MRMLLYLSDSMTCRANASLRIVDFVERLTMHAVARIMAVVQQSDGHCEIKPDKVGAWLMNEEATMWDDVCAIDPPA